MIERNNGIDSMRFFCAFFVVCQHVKFYPDFMAQYVSVLAKMAVPFFFLISGNYLYDKRSVIFKDNLKSAIKKISSMAMVYTLLYVGWWWVRDFFPNIFQEKDFSVVSFIAFNGDVEHLWYIYAFLYTLISLYFFGGVIVRARFIISAFVVYVSVSLYSRWIDINSYESWIDLNWIVSGLPYVLAGCFVKKHRDFFNKLSFINLKLILALLFSVYIEHGLLKYFIGRGPSVVFMYFLCVAILIYLTNGGHFFTSKVEKFSARMGRIISFDVYIHHIWVRDIFWISGLKWLANPIIVFGVVWFAAYFIRRKSGDI